MEFADDYGSLPDPHTAEEVRKRTGTRIDTGTGTIWRTDFNPVLRLPERP